MKQAAGQMGKGENAGKAQSQAESDLKAAIAALEGDIEKLKKKIDLNKLIRDQALTREQIEELIKKVRKKDGDLADELQKAAKDMQEAEDSLAGGNPRRANAKEKDALKKINDIIDKVNNNQAIEALMRIEEVLMDMVETQSQILDNTRSLDQQINGKLSPRPKERDSRPLARREWRAVERR